MLRQADVKDGVPARFALGRDAAAMFLDDLAHDEQAEPGTVAGLLGGVERLEDAIDDLRRDPRPVVAHLDVDHVRGRAAVRPALEAGRRRRRVALAPRRGDPDLAALAD